MKSGMLPRLPRLPLLEGTGDIEKDIAAEFLDWAELEIAGWPDGTRTSMAKLREWFQAKGHADPADRILAFVTMLEFMRRNGGPVLIDPELAEIERIAKDVFGPETRLYWVGNKS